VRHERGRELGVDPLQELREARVGREALHEVLVVEDHVADLAQLHRVQVQEVPALEPLGVDAVVRARKLDRRFLQLLDEAGRVGLGGLERARLHDHHDVFQLAEVARVLRVALDVARALGQHVAARGLEAELERRVSDSGDGEDQGDRDGEPGAPAREPDQAAERAAGSGNRDHTEGLSRLRVSVPSSAAGARQTPA
jgi:hypothetical protein